MTDIEKDMDETMDMEPEKLEISEKPEGIAPNNQTNNESQLQSQTETEDSVDGYSSDFQLEESRGYRCLPTSTSLTNCLIGKTDHH